MLSADTNKLIDAEIRALVEGAHKRATGLLTSHREQLNLLAEALLEYETLSGEEINHLLETGKVDRPDRPSGPTLVQPVAGSAVPKAGKKLGGSGGTAPQGA